MNGTSGIIRSEFRTPGIGAAGNAYTVDVGAGVFGVVSVLVIADLTRGTGRFNLTLGAVATAVGIGAALSQTIAGSIVHHFGDRAGFLFLAFVAAAAFAILWLFMPETLDWTGDAPARGSIAKR